MSAGLEVVLGLIFVYLILSLVCTGINETVASVFAWRPRLLREGIRSLLEDPNGEGLAGKVEEHPLIQSLVRSRRRDLRTVRGGSNVQRLVEWWRQGRYPSYMPSRQFVTALLDVVEKNPDLLEKEEGKPVREVLRVLKRGARDFDEQRRQLETWYDDGMERVSGWYRRRVQLFMWAWAVAIVVAVNADSLQIARTLWRDDTIRAAVVARAEATAAAEQQEASSDVRQIARDVNNLQSLDLPIGWKSGLEWSEVPRRVPGWLATAFAITLGAPFWFDLLSKVARIRSTGAPPPARTAAHAGAGKRDEEGREAM